MKDIAFHITDITENSIRAGASEVRVGIAAEGSELTISISDNGRGMSAETIEKATNPFYTTRKVGLGLPFLIQNAEQSGGNVKIESQLGVGTTVKALFMLDNIDCPAVGDIAETMMLIMTGNPDINTVFSVSNVTAEFEISTEDIKEAVDGIPIGHPEIAVMVRDIISGNIKEVMDGKI